MLLLSFYSRAEALISLVIIFLPLKGFGSEYLFFSDFVDPHGSEQ